MHTSSKDGICTKEELPRNMNKTLTTLILTIIFFLLLPWTGVRTIESYDTPQDFTESTLVHFYGTELVLNKFQVNKSIPNTVERGTLVGNPATLTFPVSSTAILVTISFLLALATSNIKKIIKFIKEEVSDYPDKVKLTPLNFIGWGLIAFGVALMFSHLLRWYWVTTLIEIGPLKTDGLLYSPFSIISSSNVVVFLIFVVYVGLGVLILKRNMYGFYLLILAILFNIAQSFSQLLFINLAYQAMGLKGQFVPLVINYVVYVGITAFILISLISRRKEFLKKSK